MMTNAGCVMKVLESEVVEELPRDCDFVTYLKEIREHVTKSESSAVEIDRQIEWYQTQGKKKRLQQPHVYVKIAGEAVIPYNDSTAQMMFGKYKGKRLEDVPEHYFQYLIKKHCEDIARYVTEVQRRKALERLTGERVIVGEMEW